MNTRLAKEIENTLRQTVSTLTATLESTLDGILVVDTQKRVITYNQRFVEMWQIPASVLEPRDDEQILAFVQSQLQDPEAFLAKVHQLYSTPGTKCLDTITFRDGRVFERYTQPQIVDGTIVGRVWNFRDITQRVRADEEQTQLVTQLETANRTLANVNRELNDFAYIVSHDLKAPLRGISTLAHWISTDCADKLDGEGQENLHLLVNRVGRMHDLIEGILQYSRVGRTQEAIAALDLSELLANVIDILAPPDHITITVVDELPTVHAEQTKIQQVFQNLLSNAIKYMDKPQGQIEVRCRQIDGTWRFSVVDNGPGIDEKDFRTIFVMFQTLGPRDGYESTGVGLALVRKIVELYGGTVWVESQRGKGSSFHFTLPKAQKETTDAQLQTSTAC